MNKKTLIVLIVVPIVVVIIVGILGSQFFFKPREVSVTGVEFLGDDGKPFADAAAKSFRLDVTSGEASKQLKWKVSPDNADNKAVTFTSSNSAVTVSAEGLVKSSTPFIGATITVKTADGGKTDTINIETTSTAAQDLAYDFDTNSLDLGSSTTEVKFDAEENKYVVFRGTNYKLQASGVTFAVQNNDGAVKFNQGEFSADNLGTFTVSATSGGSTKTLAFEVIEKVKVLTLPTHLQNATVNDYLVGSQNNYKFEYLTNVHDDPQVETKVYLGSTLLTGETLTSVVAIDGNNFQFKSAANGNAYKVEVAFKYDASVKIEYTFTVTDGWNVSNHAELLAAFNEGENQKEHIVLVKDITVDADSCFTVAGNEYVRTGTGEADHSGRIYVRYHDVVLDGNGHTVSAENAKYFQAVMESNNSKEVFCHDGNPAIFQIAKIEERSGKLVNVTRDDKSFYYSPELRAHWQTQGDDPTYANSSAYVETERTYLNSFYDGTGTFVPVNATFNNVVVKANSGMNVSSGETYVGFRSLNGIKASGANVTLDGCELSRVLNGVTSVRSASVTIKDSTIDDVAGFCVYTRVSRKLVLDGSTFGHAGHAAVLPQTDYSGQMIDGFVYYDGVKEFLDSTNQGQYANTTYFDAYGSPNFNALPSNGHTIELKGNVVFDNWLDLNNSAFLQADTSSYAAAKQLVAAITQMLGSNNGIILKVREGGEASNPDDLMMNYGIQLESAVAQSGRVNFTTLINNLNKKSPLFDQAAMFKTVMNGQSGGALYTDYAGQNGITKSFLDLDTANSNRRTIMSLGLNMKALKSGGNYYLSQFILGINEAFQQG
ncbi:MAG: Ig-like domain-containing protein [Corallococcus sp.]|nr:Ig-like domain-containing protein [Corallococcus sp.]MCM1359072.1 Ig-like domain-containing protein [Corallococcus sp.]MCM1395061.1 Ig-like domain-containing protein [Corallococcus sp.]